MKLKNKKKFVKFLFIYFTFFTSYFTMRTLSRYISVVKKDGSEVIAKWDIDVTADSESINLVSGNGSKSYNLTVTSDSETKVLYSIILTNVPNDIFVSIDGKSNTSPSNNKVIFDNLYINANDSNKTRQHTLTFTAPINSSVINNNDIKIDVIFTQGI